MPTISPVLRITVGLLLLTVSLLLMGDLLGIVPDQKQSEIDARKMIAESLAIQISSEIGEKHSSKAVSLLNIIVERNKNILSIGLRTNTKQLTMKSNGHELHWASREDDRSTPTHMQVPIYDSHGRWGTLEVSFTPIGGLWSNIFTSRSFTAMILFVFVFGFITYWLFLRRVLSELDPSAVVPYRVRSALDALNEGLVILDTNERIVLVNTSLKKKLGLSESKLVGKRLSSLDWKENSTSASLKNQKFPWNILFETNEIPPAANLQLKTHHHGTLTCNVNVSPIKASHDKLKGAVVTIDDITELEKNNNELARILLRLENSQDEIKRQNLELTELAMRDHLTQVLNRRALYEGMNTLLTEAYEQSNTLSCIMLDIDHFKSINDRYGHAIGDKVIQICAHILHKTARPNDLVGRYGGEEFVVVLPGLDEFEAVKIAEEIRLVLFTQEHPELPENLVFSSSFGVSSTISNIWKADQLVDCADQALYVAKQSGRNRVKCYSQKARDSRDLPKTANNVFAKSKNDSNANASVSHRTMSRDEQAHIPQPHPDHSPLMERSSHTVILDRLTQAKKTAQRNKTSVAVLTIFIDTIQLTNNAIGHASAEKLKKIAYKRLTEIFRVSDSVVAEVDTGKSISLSRSSDSEFTAILSGIEEAKFTTWAIFRMFKELSIPVNIDGNEIVMTANIGASIYPNDAEHPEELLSHSGMALQKAKEEGRGEFLFYNHEMNDLSKQVLQIESQLHQAIKREELYLEFQPIANTKTGVIEKVESLLRWKHPELGLVVPTTFIEIAEHTGMIKTIGAWVIQKSCQQLHIWHNQGHDHLLMSINLSAIQLHQKYIAEDIIDIVIKEGISPASIVFELTETVLLKQHDAVLDVISTLHQAGFKIALDDFGTGYSALHYLQKFPIRWVKIDRSFMSEFPKDMHTISIVSGIISLCHNLAIGVIAEGVEDESQLLMLHDLKCDEVQGFLISRPLLAEGITAFLASTHSRRLAKKLDMIHHKSDHAKNLTSLTDILNTPPSVLS